MALAGLAVLGVPGGATSSANGALPADQIVFMVDVGGGLIPPVVYAMESPALVMYGDGRILSIDTSGALDLPGVELNIGSPVPDTVVVHDIPDVKYRYAVVNKRTVIVDRDSGKIVKIYD